jgi:hypothetical protein
MTIDRGGELIVMFSPGNTCECHKCSHGNVVNACRSLYSVVVIDQPQEDNIVQH